MKSSTRQMGHEHVAKPAMMAFTLSAWCGLLVPSDEALDADKRVICRRVSPVRVGRIETEVVRGDGVV